MGMKVENLEEGKGKYAGDVWMTTLCVLILEIKFGDKKGSWELVVAKARKWLKKQGVQLEEEAKKFLTEKKVL